MIIETIDEVPSALPIDRSAASVIFVPELAMPIRSYRKFLDRWEATGRIIRALDLYSGSSMPRDYSTFVIETLPAAVAELSANGPVVLAGHGLGGRLALIAAGASVPGVAGVAVIACGDPRPPAPPKVDLAGLLGTSAGRAVGGAGDGGSILGGILGRKRAGLTGDPEAEALAVTRVNAPVLALGIEGDPIITPEDIERLIVTITAPVDRADIVVPGRGASLHQKWAKDPDAVIAALELWLAG